MACIQRLTVSRLRNLSHIDIQPSSQINCIVGRNGSGKTSLLEAISLIGLGRSFRSLKNRTLIQNEQPDCVIFSKLEDSKLGELPVGLLKNRQGQTEIKVAGEKANAVVLAQQLPLQIIDAHAFELIEGSPTQRRQFLDWMVFHVKPDFIHCWQRVQKSLKQRNQLLRQEDITYHDCEPWDRELSQLAQKIHEMRQSVFDQYLASLEAHQLLDEFMLANNIKGLDLLYQAGFDTELDFGEQLKADFHRDRQLGYTRHGPQRADVALKIGNKPAVDVLSRGQSKSLICAMHLAQAEVYQQQKQKQCVFLVDDLLAELDKHNAQRLADWLARLGSQIFVTGIHKDDLASLWSEDDLSEPVSWFHVEQGAINE